MWCLNTNSGWPSGTYRKWRKRDGITTKAISLCQCNCIAYAMYIFTVWLLTTHTLFTYLFAALFLPFSNTHALLSLCLCASRLPFCKYICIHCLVSYYYYFSFILLSLSYLFIFCCCCCFAVFWTPKHCHSYDCVCASKRRISSHSKRCHFYGLLSLVFRIWQLCNYQHIVDTHTLCLNANSMQKERKIRR